MRLITLVACICVSLCLNAQLPFYFDKALRIDSVAHYGREALYTDLVALQLYQHGAAPTAPQWKSVTADSLHQFHNRSFGGGSYLYTTYIAGHSGTALLNVKGCSCLFFNGIPHAGDAYGSGWLYIPVQLKAGVNELYFRPAGPAAARLLFGSHPLTLNTEDPTLPSIRVEKPDTALYGAVVLINQSVRSIHGARIRAVLAGREVVSILPDIPPMSSRKVPFRIDAAAITAKGRYTCQLTLLVNGKSADQKEIRLSAIAPGERYDVTFLSQVDGSLQYYAVTPQTPASQPGAALFLSVHGAGVEASGQAAAYEPKSWGTLVAATNRRPRGFNWEDWGRLDALEVLALATAAYQPDPHQIFLTGHSMGGHGTWFLGATYPAKWAAIGACSGYPTLREYGSHDGVIPDSGHTDVERLLLRASDQSDVPQLATNYKPLGVYILHGDADPVVSVKYARQMRRLLADFHADMSYYEYPGGEHWYGNQSVDWKPLFEFFRWHRSPADSAVNTIDFITSSPGVSSAYHWAVISQQTHPLLYSRLLLSRDLKAHKINGATTNTRLLALDLSNFGNTASVTIQLDSSAPLTYTTHSSSDTVYLQKTAAAWQFAAKPGTAEKGPDRYGTFKEAFGHRMVFVYATAGSKAENEWSFNKARYDAETWYYRGNGAVDMVADTAYTLSRYNGRNVILYGNAATNAAWDQLLKHSPIYVTRNELKAGDKTFTGDDIACYFIRPLDQPGTSVAVITGTGLKGMQAANANQYFAGGSGFPDYMIFNLSMLQKGAAGVLLAGFFDNNWKLTPDEMAQNNR
jgi:predicted esterase